MPRLGEFLHHYRVLGVERFIFVDNGSTDGTPEYLGRQPDIDLFTTDEPFGTQRKQGWIHRLIGDYGCDRWYLVVDADEHVVFAGDDRASFGEVAAAAQTRGATRVRGCLVDMYAEGPILATCREPGTTLRDTYGWFDPGGYAEHRNALLVSRVGGPRRRVLGKVVPGFEPQLTKYPLFRPRDGDVAANPHYIWPGDPSPEDRCHLGILHFKFDGDFLSKIDDAVERRQYWRDSVEYRAYRDALRHDPLLSFHWAASRRYRSARDLVACGLIEPLLDFAGVELDDHALGARHSSGAFFVDRRPNERHRSSALPAHKVPRSETPASSEFGRIVRTAARESRAARLASLGMRAVAAGPADASSTRAPSSPRATR